MTARLPYISRFRKFILKQRAFCHGRLRPLWGRRQAFWRFRQMYWRRRALETAQCLSGPPPANPQSALIQSFKFTEFQRRIVQLVITGTAQYYLKLSLFLNMEIEEYDRVDDYGGKAFDIAASPDEPMDVRQWALSEVEEAACRLPEMKEEMFRDWDLYALSWRSLLKAVIEDCSDVEDNNQQHLSQKVGKRLFKLLYVPVEPDESLLASLGDIILYWGKELILYG